MMCVCVSAHPLIHSNIRQMEYISAHGGGKKRTRISEASQTDVLGDLTTQRHHTSTSSNAASCIQNATPVISISDWHTENREHTPEHSVPPVKTQ